PSDRHVDLPHVDLRAEVVVGAVAVDLRREAEEGGEVEAGLATLDLGGEERGQKSGADAGNLLLCREAAGDRSRLTDCPVSVDAERVHVPRDGETPSIAHLLDELGKGVARESEHRNREHQSEALHFGRPPAEPDYQRPFWREGVTKVYEPAEGELG